MTDQQVARIIYEALNAYRYEALSAQRDARVANVTTHCDADGDVVQVVLTTYDGKKKQAWVLDSLSICEADLPKIL